MQALTMRVHVAWRRTCARIGVLERTHCFRRSMVYLAPFRPFLISMPSLAEKRSPAREMVVSLRHAVDKVPAVTRVRSTLLRSSLMALERQGLTDAYRENLPAEVRDEILGVVPGTWVEIGLAMAHYRAIDSLQLKLADQLALGGAVGTSVQGLLVGTMMRVARGVGLTPWTGVGQYARIWDRLFVGGDLEVEKVHRAEAVVTMYGLRLFGVPYFRVAMRGLQQTGLSAIWTSRKAHVVEAASSETMLSCRISWI